MHKTVGLTATQQRESSPLGRQCWEQTCGKIDAVQCCRHKVSRCPGTHFQVEGIRVTGSAGEQDEDGILGLVQYDGRFLCDARLPKQIQRRDKVACNAGAGELEKYATIDNHGFSPFLIVEDELELVQECPLNVFSGPLGSEPTHDFHTRGSFRLRWWTR